jgi:hypothetical protein
VIYLVAAVAVLVLEGAAADPGQPIPSRDIRWSHFRVAGWSSAGIVFVRYLDRQKNPDSYEIAVASLDGRNRQVVGGGGDDCTFEASVSPSGSEIEYSDAGDYNADEDRDVCDIFLIRADGSERRNLTNTPGIRTGGRPRRARACKRIGPACRSRENSDLVAGRTSSRVHGWSHVREDGRLFGCPRRVGPPSAHSCHRLEG